MKPFRALFHLTPEESSYSQVRTPRPPSPPNPHVLEISMNSLPIADRTRTQTRHENGRSEGVDEVRKFLYQIIMGCFAR